MDEQSNAGSTVELAVELTIAWLSNPNTRASADEVNEFLTRMRGAVGGLDGRSQSVTAADAEQAAEVVPAVSVRKSLASRDHIVSLIDGKPYKTLRRHLSTHGMTPEQYRERFGLRPDYPMTAPSYSETRRAMAKSIGLGTKRNRTAPGTAPKRAGAKG